MAKSPLALVKDKFGGKAKLVEAVKAFANDGDLWVARTNADKGLELVSNAKLLRLHATFTAVKEKFGTRQKLIDAVVTLEKRDKDDGFKKRLAAYPVPRLFDMWQSASKRSAKAAKAPKAEKAAKPAKPAKAAKKPAAAKKAKLARRSLSASRRRRDQRLSSPGPFSFLPSLASGGRALAVDAQFRATRTVRALLRYASSTASGFLSASSMPSSCIASSSCSRLEARAIMVASQLSAPHCASAPRVSVRDSLARPAPR